MLAIASSIIHYLGWRVRNRLLCHLSEMLLRVYTAWPCSRTTQRSQPRLGIHLNRSQTSWRRCRRMTTHASMGMGSNGSTGFIFVTQQLENRVAAEGSRGAGLVNRTGHSIRHTLLLST